MSHLHSLSRAVVAPRERAEQVFALDQHDVARRHHSPDETRVEIAVEGGAALDRGIDAVLERVRRMYA